MVVAAGAENAGLEGQGLESIREPLLQRGAAERVKPPMVMARVRWQCKELSDESG